MSAFHRGGRGRFFVDLFACFLIPAYTLLFACGTRWFGSNFSVLAVTGADRYRGFVLWGLLAGGYFLVLLFQIVRTLPSRALRRTLGLILLSAGLSLWAALITPYLPEYSPRHAHLHVLLSACSCVLLMAAVLLILLHCRRDDPPAYAGLLRAWSLIAAVSGALFLLSGMVTSALEVFFIISASLLVRSLWLRCLPR